jgi:hypothetical protein
MIPKYDIFSGSLSGNSAFWVGCAEGLEKAKEFMNGMAVEKPGPFFVFSVSEQKIVAQVDTSNNQRSAATSRG